MKATLFKFNLSKDTSNMPWALTVWSRKIRNIEVWIIVSKNWAKIWKFGGCVIISSSNLDSDSGRINVVFIFNICHITYLGLKISWGSFDEMKRFWHLPFLVLGDLFALEVEIAITIEGFLGLVILIALVFILSYQIQSI